MSTVSLRCVVIDSVEVWMTDDELHRVLETGQYPPSKSGQTSMESPALTKILRELDELGFEREVRFRGLNGKRLFRCDAALARKRVCFDYHGAGGGAAHRSRKSQAIDHEKVSELALCRWVYIVCNAISVNSGKCREYIERALREAA